MIPPERPLQRETIDRPLILRVQRQLHRAGVHVVPVGVFSNGVGDAAARGANERVLQCLVVHPDFPIIAPVVALVPELHAVRTGHVVGGRVPRRAPRPVVQPALRSVAHRCDKAGRNRLEDLNHLHEVSRRVVFQFLATPLVVRGAESGFEEKSIGERRGPTRRLDALRIELAVAVRFGRGRENKIRRTGERRRARTFAADGLFIPRPGELVAGGDLPGDTRRVVLPGAI